MALQIGWDDNLDSGSPNMPNRVADGQVASETPP